MQMQMKMQISMQKRHTDVDGNADVEPVDTHADGDRDAYADVYADVVVPQSADAD